MGQVVEMDRRLLVGVVAARCRQTFIWALKARQLRSYLCPIPLAENKAVPGSEADLSTDFRIGQAWMSAEAQRERWGWLRYFQKRRRIVTSVRETRGQVLTYQGKPIYAAYHSTSGGQTQPAADYFNPVPYLLGVPSPGEGISLLPDHPQPRLAGGALV